MEERETKTTRETMETSQPAAIKPDLSQENLDWKIFEVAKYVAADLYGKKQCFIQWEADKIFPELAKAGLRDEKILLECLLERANKHNGTIHTAVTKIKALRKEGWWRSKLFRGIGLDTDKIKKLVKQHQHYDSWEIRNVYFDSSYQPKEHNRF